MEERNSVDTHYPNYDVLKMMDEWDSHTKEIVRSRLGPFAPLKYLSDAEAADIYVIAGHLVYDNREEILQWVVHHLDDKLANKTGEGERKQGVPPEDILIRAGLKAINHAGRLTYGKEFADLTEPKQFELLANLQKGKVSPIPEWSQIPQQDLFKKLVSVITAAYYSHPAVWSEIGYGGPMYPKTYARIELGLPEPWEAKRYEK